jgi:hypothetical protein
MDRPRRAALHRVGPVRATKLPLPKPTFRAIDRHLAARLSEITACHVNTAVDEAPRAKRPAEPVADRDCDGSSARRGSHDTNYGRVVGHGGCVITKVHKWCSEGVCGWVKAVWRGPGKSLAFQS